MIRKHWLLLIGALTILSSCNDDVFQSAKVDPEGDTWTCDNVVRLDFEIKDTTRLFDLSIKVTHTTDYRWENLYIRINNTFPDGDTLRNSVSLGLASKKGKWQGDCSGRECVAVIDLQKKFFFPKVGQYSIWAEQYMREDSIAGIKSIELSLANNKESS
jgi:gliding motility-associated lipoprotein GldH